MNEEEAKHYQFGAGYAFTGHSWNRLNAQYPEIGDPMCDMALEGYNDMTKFILLQQVEAKYLKVFSSTGSDNP